MNCEINTARIHRRAPSDLRILVVVAALAAGAPSWGETVDPHHPPEGRFVDEWAEIYMAGGKVGYAHTALTRRGNAVETSTTTSIRLGRADQPVEIRIVEKTDETLSGHPLRFSTQTHASMMTTEMTGTIQEGKVEITTSQFGVRNVQTFDFPEGALMTWGLYRENLLRGLAPGTRYKLPVYSPQLRLDGAVNALTEVGQKESFEHRGRTRRGQRVDVTMELPVGSLKMTSWVDPDGRPLKARVPLPGLGKLEIILTDEKTALRDFLPPEIFLRTFVKVDRSIDPDSARRVRYLIRPKTPEAPLPAIPKTDMQSVVKQREDAVELVVERQAHPASEARPQARNARHTPGEFAEFLQPNLMVNTDDPELVKLAKDAGGGETRPFALADRLRRFVSEYVETKSLDVGFATAGEVARTRKGDCTEHGVLLAALGRINGLPSRVAVGLAYVPSFAGQTDVFGYHLWTQFYIDGRWIDVDAALNETRCSPTRIALATSSLKHSGLADLSLPLLSAIGSLQIEILELDPASLTDE